MALQLTLEEYSRLKEHLQRSKQSGRIQAAKRLIHLTDDERDQICELFRKYGDNHGVISKIAREVHRNPYTVSGVLHDRDLRERKRHSA